MLTPGLSEVLLKAVFFLNSVLNKKSELQLNRKLVVCSPKKNALIL